MTDVKLIRLTLAAMLSGMLLPEPTFAKKKSTVMLPASKPPVYKKFDNRKKKSQMKLGTAHR